MKKKLLALFVLGASHVLAQATTATCTFTCNNSNPAPTEIVIEQKNAAGLYTEVTKGPASPVIFVLSNQVSGSTLTFRIRARVPGNAASISTPTADLVAIVPAATPGNPNVTVVFTSP